MNLLNKAIIQCAIKHTVTQSEKQAFAQYVNQVLKFDQHMKDRIPFSPQSIFDQVQDGVIFCKLINQAIPGKVPIISPQAINLNPATTYHKIENLNLAILSAKSIGCTLINIRPQFIIQKRQHIIFGLIWQIIRIHLSNQITLQKHPQINVLKKQDQDVQIFKKIGYEQIIIRWLNYHIKKNNGNRIIKNLGNDLADSEAYGHLLTNIANLPIKFWAQNNESRCKEVIKICHVEKIQTKIRPEDIMSGNITLNTIFCVNIFNQRHGLKLLKIVQIPPETQTDESRQIRVFKNWINSQGIENVFVNYLMNDLRDGRILLKVLQNFKPRIVDWEKRYSSKLNNRIHIIQNCNYVLQICKNLGVKLIGIDGVDIVDGKVSLTLGLVWQIFKIYWEHRVGKINEQQLIKWANNKVPTQLRIKSLKDTSIANCKLLLQVLNSIKPKIAKLQNLKNSQNEQDQISNINYTIASARKLGSEIVTLWQHIKQSNPKYIGLLLAQLQYIDKNLNR